MLRLLLFLCFALACPLYSQTIPHSAPAIESKTTGTTRFEVGAGFYSLIPDKFVGFDHRIFGYGPQLNYTWGPWGFEIKALYGDSLRLSVILADADLRFYFRTPVLNWFVSVGGHLLHYRPSQLRFSEWGPNVGVGLRISFDSKIAALLGLKVYMQSKNLVSMGAGIVYSL